MQDKRLYNSYLAKNKNKGKYSHYKSFATCLDTLFQEAMNFILGFALPGPDIQKNALNIRLKNETNILHSKPTLCDSVQINKAYVDKTNLCKQGF